MKALVNSILALATASVAVVMTSAPSSSFVLMGHSLDLQQRDFRVFNNMTSAGANQNQVPDANFPGAQGFVQALWKGAIEWSSGLHGNGDGDPTQPGDLGSGGANFDFSFQGEANQVGILGDNICSGIPGGGTGLGAFAEIAPSGDWRMRFSQGVPWADGPGAVSGGEVDLQAVACHLFGHCLGLGHTSVPGATMSPSSPQRSLHADDTAGVQALYGVADASKPVVTGVTLNGNSLTLDGSNFSSQGNEVWLTRRNFEGDGTPLKVVGVSSSSGGTLIVVPLPPNARSGDVLVQSALAGPASLSNPYPIELPGTVCPGMQILCDAPPNSTGAPGGLSVFGSQSVMANDTILLASQVPTNQFGIFLYGQGTQSVPVGNGVFCLLGSSFFRLPVIHTGSQGAVTFSLDLNNLPPTGEIQAGETWNFQLWHRENGGTSNLTHAVTYTWCQ